MKISMIEKVLRALRIRRVAGGSTCSGECQGFL